MEWRDTGILLSVRPHGESAAIVDVLTEAHGRHGGVVRGGQSRRLRPILQPGATLDLTWTARLEAHLGAFRVEPLRQRMAPLMHDPLALGALEAVCALCSYALPERESHPRIYTATTDLLDHLQGDPALMPVAYLRWELLLLDELGFGLDLTRCARTGATGSALRYVSPRSGRAVSEAGAGDWAPRLLALPGFLVRPELPDAAAIAEGFALTGHFLSGHLAAQHGDRPLPAPRDRLRDRLMRQAMPRG